MENKTKVQSCSSKWWICGCLFYLLKKCKNAKLSEENEMTQEAASFSLLAVSGMLAGTLKLPIWDFRKPIAFKQRSKCALSP